MTVSTGTPTRVDRVHLIVITAMPGLTRAGLAAKEKAIARADVVQEIMRLDVERVSAG